MPFHSAVSTIDSTTGSFTTGVTSVCHQITVFGNDVVEPDGTIVVTIIDTSLEPSNTQLNTYATEVAIVDDDSELKSAWSKYNSVIYNYPCYMHGECPMM